MMKTVKNTAEGLKELKRRAGKRIGSHAAGFAEDESGVLIGFAVFLILMMLAVGGIGVDLMRFEFTRTSLQATLDRAVLAAADLDQELDAQFVVEDYFDKSNLGDYLRSVKVDEGTNHKQVDATAEVAMKTQLIHMLGVPVLNAKAVSAARESIGSVEISLVLDVSGSMASNGKLTNLKSAANKFVDLVLTPDNLGDVSISVVPYATQVSLGKGIMDKYNVTQEHSSSYCIDFLADEFNSTDISTTFQWQRTAHFDPFTSAGDNINQEQVGVNGSSTLKFPVCPTDPATRILPLSNNSTALHDHINGLYAKGNTSIDLGMKWGVALLDPAAQPVVKALIDDKTDDVEIDSAFANRPYAYDPVHNLKIAIVMTDGQNTNQYYMLPPYNEGLSPVWRHNSGKYSVKHDNTWWYPSDGQWHNEPYKDSLGQGSTQLTYPELFASGPLHWMEKFLFAPWMGETPANSQWYWGIMNWHNDNWKDQRLDRICKAAKEKGVIVFTIAFEAPRQGKRVLNNCASSDGHYFDANGLDIEDAFVAIASSISKLRLIQ